MEEDDEDAERDESIWYKCGLMRFTRSDQGISSCSTDGTLVANVRSCIDGSAE